MSGPLRFSQFFGCWLILSVCWFRLSHIFFRCWNFLVLLCNLNFNTMLNVWLSFVKYVIYVILVLTMDFHTVLRWLLLWCLPDCPTFWNYR
jgi:hypothetical protein